MLVSYFDSNSVAFYLIIYLINREYLHLVFNCVKTDLDQIRFLIVPTFCCKQENEIIAKTFD